MAGALWKMAHAHNTYVVARVRSWSMHQCYSRGCDSVLAYRACVHTSAPPHACASTCSLKHVCSSRVPQRREPAQPPPLPIRLGGTDMFTFSGHHSQRCCFHTDRPTDVLLHTRAPPHALQCAPRAPRALRRTAVSPRPTRFASACSLSTRASERRALFVCRRFHAVSGGVRRFHAVSPRAVSCVLPSRRTAPRACRLLVSPSLPVRARFVGFVGYASGYGGYGGYAMNSICGSQTGL